MPIYPYSFQLPPLNLQDIPSNGAVGEFLGISAGGVLDWLPVVAGGGGDMLKSENLSGLANYTTARTNIGLGTASTPTFANLTLTSPSLSSSAPVTISQTWDHLPTAFTALKVNATSTNSAAGSLLLDLQLGGVSKLSITKAGTINFGNVQANFDPYISRVASGTLAVSLFGFNQNHVSLGYFGGANNTPGVTVSSTGSFAWSSNSINSEATRDTILLRDGAANTLALRNGANAQTFNVYGTYTSNTVYERMFAKYNATDLAFQIGTETAGATLRPLDFVTGGTRRMTLTSAGNVGIGTTAPGAPLEIRGTAVSDIRETLFKGTISDAGNDAFYIFNGTSVNGRFAPSFSASTFSSNIGFLLFSSQTTAVNDSGTSPLMLFQSRLTTSETDPSNGTLSVVNNRPLFAFQNFTTIHMQMAANGNLGIGTTSPTSNLTVAQSTAGVGTISVGAGGTTVTGVGTQFLNTFAVGQTITSAGQTLTISAIASDTSMTISPAAGAAISGQAYTLVGGTRFSVAGNGKVGIGANLFLERDGDNQLALRNGTAAQALRVYNTYTDASNYERAFTEWGSNVYNIGTHASGTGSYRKLAFYGNGIDFNQSNVGLRWSINTNGDFLAGTNNAYDIGASNASRPRNVYVGSQLTVGTSGTFGSFIYAENYYFSTAKGLLAAPSDGVFTFSNRAATDFTRLGFGGTTDAFPAVARDGAGIKFTGAAAGSTSWIKVPPVAVSALPLAATAGAGARAFVNDASAPVFGSAVTGGGAVLVPVYSTGSAWNVG